MPFTNDPNEHKAAMRAVVIIAVVAMIAVASVFIFSGNGEGERIAVFVASVFGFLAPILTAFLVIAQGKTTTEQLNRVERTQSENTGSIKTVAQKVDRAAELVIEKEMSTPGALEATSKRIEEKIDQVEK